ncbi:MAG: hypothetical protein HY738_07015 [Bacteroidia bacterium]|nr:hypothetical protein [Bacteroidia bacterium]
MKSKFDNMILGTILGFIIPLLAFGILYYFNKEKISQFKELFMLADIHIAAFSLCVVPNLLLFFIFIWKNYYFSARGVLFATLLYTITVFIIKYI